MVVLPKWLRIEADARAAPMDIQFQLFAVW
jgi:hypothetical protein